MDVRHVRLRPPRFQSFNFVAFEVRVDLKRLRVETVAPEAWDKQAQIELGANRFQFDVFALIVCQQKWVADDEKLHADASMAGDWGLAPYQ
jgi:hypothetical protein